MKDVVVRIAEDPVQRWIDDLPDPVNTTYPVYEAHEQVTYVRAGQYETATADADRPVVATDRLHTCVGVLLSDDEQAALLAHAQPAREDRLTEQLKAGYDAVWGATDTALQATYAVGSIPCPQTLQVLDAAHEQVEQLAGSVEETLVYSTTPGDTAERPAGTIAYDTRSGSFHTYRKPYRIEYGVTFIPDNSMWNGE